MLLLALAPLVLAAPPVPASLQTGTAPSFACTAAAAPVEKAICADPSLAALDREMGQLFGLARQSSFGAGPSNQLAAQRTALREIRACDAPKAARPLRACLEQRYATRNQALAIAVLISAPATALPVLRRGDPGFAPILEAVQLWSEAPVDARWDAPERARARARITSLLQPYLTALQTSADQSYGNSILRDPGADGVAVKTIADVFRSDRHFAAFLNVIGPYLDEPNVSGMPRTLPCAAIVRHPALLRATGPVFGSTLDSFILGNDCRETLPPLPALDALEAKLWQRWPPCDGTIRFSFFRGFASDIDRARLGASPRAGKSALPARKGVTAADTARAERELAAHYVRYLHQDGASAARAARDAMVEIMTDAHAC